uniref:Uncharacterized protein n=1 Tax=Mycena chlorophos TaxID=658473 RepID=A0ABQ0L2B7_MYCCL|nr:predicted protein [Mycena chlorophos]
MAPIPRSTSPRSKAKQRGPTSVAMRICGLGSGGSDSVLGLGKGGRANSKWVHGGTLFNASASDSHGALTPMRDEEGNPRIASAAWSTCALHVSTTRKQTSDVANHLVLETRRSSDPGSEHTSHRRARLPLWLSTLSPSHSAPWCTRRGPNMTTSAFSRLEEHAAERKKGCGSASANRRQPECLPLDALVTVPRWDPIAACCRPEIDPTYTFSKRLSPQYAGHINWQLNSACPDSGRRAAREGGDEYPTKQSTALARALEVKTVDAGKERGMARALHQEDAILGCVVESRVLTKAGPVKRHLVFKPPEGMSAQAGDYVAI